VKDIAIIRVQWDPKFLAIVPAINFNFHSETIEFEWLWLGIY
jgi:hypothetical protein